MSKRQKTPHYRYLPFLTVNNGDEAIKMNEFIANWLKRLFAIGSRFLSAIGAELYYNGF